MRPASDRLPPRLGVLAALLSCAGLAAPFALLLSNSAGARQSAAFAYVREESSTARTASAAHLQVSEVEYRLSLSRAVVKAGPLDLEQIDAGTDSHDLRLRRNGSSSTIYGRLLTPGKRWDGVIHLKPGVYSLWCSLPEHEKLGMHATLHVVR